MEGDKMADLAKRIRALADEVEACGSGEDESQEEEGEAMEGSGDKSQMLKLASASIKQGMKKNF